MNHRLALGGLLFLPCLLTGCLMVPTPELDYGPDHDFSRLVGPADSDAPIRPGSATLATVLEKLGTPDRRWADDTILAYDRKTTKGFTFTFLLGDAGGLEYWWRDYFLYLRFDRDGKLTHYRQLANPYSDNNVYQIDTELRRFVEETDPARAAPPRAATAPTG
jgi:hypothetical protein